MKKSILITIAIIFIFTLLFSDTSITRGPAVGEIYYIGPTVTGQGIYYSTDFGETATCMDSTLNTNILFMSIAADLTPGVVYGYSMPENLYISYDYGQEGSWIFRSSGMHIGSNSGRAEGEIYDSFSKHSENYGIDFIQHSCNGFFGSRKGVEIDNQENVGYVTVTEYTIPDSIYLLITYDNFENLLIQKVLNYNQQNGFNISRGVLDGETFMIDSYFNLFYSTDYCYTWLKKNEFNFFDFYRFGSVGGRQDGEYYMMLAFDNMMGENRHIYIYHTVDYGSTFEVFHPFSKGSEPLMANFSATTIEGIVPFSVQFCNYSIGEIISYEWDFQNDGVIDSYVAEPECTYQDTGYYSIKLTIYDNDGSNEFLRENYIHVINNVGIDNEYENTNKLMISNYPNPFNPSTTIEFSIQNDSKIELSIFNIKGQKVKTLINEFVQSGNHDIFWNGDDYSGKVVSSGIYYYKLNVNGKTEAVKKCLLLK